MARPNLSVTLSPEQKSAVVSGINLIKENLPFLVNLSKEERQALRKVGPKRSAYVNDVRKVSKANPAAIPAVVDMDEFERDTQLFVALSEIYSLLQPLFEGISDTMVLSGNESISVSDQCYAHLKTAARGNANLKLALADLAKHFGGQGKKREKLPSK